MEKERKHFMRERERELKKRKRVDVSVCLVKICEKFVVINKRENNYCLHSQWSPSPITKGWLLSAKVFWTGKGRQEEEKKKSVSEENKSE